jgi:hypothetical protein
MLLNLISQEGGGSLDYIWWILPLLCCLITMTQREEKPQQTNKETDTFFTALPIADAYTTIQDKVSIMRKEANESSTGQVGIGPSLKRLIGMKAAPVERFKEKENQPPRLYTLDDSTGSIFFEFTEVEEGGTVVKATYSPLLKERMCRLKAGLPLKIPATPIGLKCPSCGKSMLHEFNLCPYCGTDLIKE